MNIHNNNNEKKNCKKEIIRLGISEWNTQTQFRPKKKVFMITER